MGSDWEPRRIQGPRDDQGWLGRFVSGMGRFQIGTTRFISSISHWPAAKASARWGTDLQPEAGLARGNWSCPMDEPQGVHLGPAGLDRVEESFELVERHRPERLVVQSGDGGARLLTTDDPVEHQHGTTASGGRAGSDQVDLVDRIGREEKVPVHGAGIPASVRGPPQGQGCEYGNGHSVAADAHADGERDEPFLGEGHQTEADAAE